MNMHNPENTLHLSPEEADNLRSAAGVEKTPVTESNIAEFNVVDAIPGGTPGVTTVMRPEDVARKQQEIEARIAQLQMNIKDQLDAAPAKSPHDDGEQTIPGFGSANERIKELREKMGE